MKVFVMAQGDGSRWSEDTYMELPSEFKQLTPLGNETIITRTLRQLGDLDVTVIAPGEFAEYVLPFGVHLKYFRVPGSLLSGIKQAIKWMDLYDRNVVLLGDVVYSNSLISDILTMKEQYRIYGREDGNPVTGKKAKELFALVITHDLIPLLEYDIDICLERNKHARLWDLQGEIESLLYIDDYTDDLDSPEEYIQFWNKLEFAALEDDK